MEALASMSRGHRFALAACGMIVIGSIGPWVDVGSDSAGGLDKDGVITVFLAGVGLAYLLFNRIPHWAPVAVLGALTGLVGVFDIIDIEDLGGLAAVVSPGWGLYLTAIGGIALTLVAATVMRTGDESNAPFDTVAKVIVITAAALLVLFVISFATQDDVGEVSVPEPAESQRE